MNSQDSPSSIIHSTATRKPSKEEIIAAIQECATKLGHVPSQEELKRRNRNLREDFCPAFWQLHQGAAGQRI